MCSIERRSHEKTNFHFFCNMFSLPLVFVLAEDFCFDFFAPNLYVS